MTITQRNASFTAVRNRQPAPERLRALVIRHGESIKTNQAKALAFFMRVGILTPSGRLAKPYCTAE